METYGSIFVALWKMSQEKKEDLELVLRNGVQSGKDLEIYKLCRSPKKERVMEDWLDKAHDGLSVIFAISLELSSLANSFENVGNINMYKRLNTISKELEETRKTISKSLSELISERIKDSQEMTDTILKAALVGCLTTKESLGEKINEAEKSFAKAIINE